MRTLIVKDMSRLGREYLKVGELTELYFPSKGVRFIAVNDGVDSLVESGSDFNPIRNWGNELHAKDTSRKVHSVKRMQAENGERLGGKPPYGYRKRDGDSKHIVPDGETKGSVQRIFQLCSEGKCPCQIARMLKAQQVPVKNTQRELDKMVKRNTDLSALFKRLYEDNVLGKISNEQFRMLSTDYNAEQKQLAAAIPEKQTKLEKLQASAANVDAFIEKARRYTEITELTPELLWTFIERIDIGERPGRYNRNGMQEVRIIYRDVGVVDSILSAEDAENTEVHFIPSLEMVVQQMVAQTQVS